MHKYALPERSINPFSFTATFGKALGFGLKGALSDLFISYLSAIY